MNAIRTFLSIVILSASGTAYAARAEIPINLVLEVSSGFEQWERQGMEGKPSNVMPVSTDPNKVQIVLKHASVKHAEARVTAILTDRFADNFSDLLQQREVRGGDRITGQENSADTAWFTVSRKGGRECYTYLKRVRDHFGRMWIVAVSVGHDSGTDLSSGIKHMVSTAIIRAPRADEQPEAKERS